MVKNLIREALPDIVAGLVVAIVLAAVGLLKDVMKLGDSGSELLFRNATSLLLLGIIIVASLFIIFAKRTSSIAPKERPHRFGRRHRVVAIVVSLLTVALGVWSFWPSHLPTITLAVENTTEQDVVVSRFAAFALDLVTPLEDDQRLITGRAFLTSRDSARSSDSQEIRVPAGAKKMIVAEILDQSRYRRFVGMSDVFIAFTLFNKEDAEMPQSRNRIRFSRSALESLSVRAKLL